MSDSFVIEIVESPAFVLEFATVGPQGPPGGIGVSIPTTDPGEGGEVWNDNGVLVVSIGGIGSARIGTSFTVA